MPVNLRTWELSLDRFINDTVPAALVALHKKVHLEVYGRLILRSPVDTGYFRYGWYGGLEVTNVLPPEDQATYPEPSAFDRAIGPLGGLQPFASSYIFNNVDYGPELEDGRSDQAPQGIVGVTVAEYRAGLLAA